MKTIFTLFRAIYRLLQPETLQFWKKFIWLDVSDDGRGRDWRGNMFVDKAKELYLFSINPRREWITNRKKLLKALEIDNHTVSRRTKMMGLVWNMVSRSDYNKTLMSWREMVNVYEWAEKCSRLGGDMAEVGVYRGGSAKIIASVKGSVTLHLFDTFAGLPRGDKKIDVLKAGEMVDTTLKEVKLSLKTFSRIKYYQGIFPESSIECRANRFCFVHLDVDLYPGTRAGLEYFYPKISRGGVILVHDYNSLNCPGVKKAVDEYCKRVKTTPIPLWDSQVLVIKER